MLNLFFALHCLHFNRLGISVSEISKAFDSNVDYMVDILEKSYKKEITTAQENVDMYWVESLSAVHWAPFFDEG